MAYHKILHGYTTQARWYAANMATKVGTDGDWADAGWTKLGNGAVKPVFEMKDGTKIVILNGKSHLDAVIVEVPAGQVLATEDAAEAVARRTMDAYSFPNYGAANWLKAALYLIVEAGWTAREAEAILRSKWTRWAGDASGREGNTAADLKAFMNDPRNRCDRASVAALVRETFPADGSDLAGACKGEDIAELISLARMVSNGVTGPRVQKIASSLLARIEERAK